MTQVPLMPQWSGVEKLHAHHVLTVFDCGKPSLNDWLRRFALTNQQSDAARTYVIHRAGHVAGYYALAAGSVRKDESPVRIARGLANHPVGVIVLARLAVDRSAQGCGLGKALLADALGRALQAADVIGARAILVQALDEEAAAFYTKFGFERSPLDGKQLMLLMKDVRAALKSARAG